VARLRIFGAIEALPGGFDGLNAAIIAALRRWLLAASADALARTDPDRPRLTTAELEAEAAVHGRWAARATQLLDRYPRTPAVMRGAMLPSMLLVVVPITLMTAGLSGVASAIVQAATCSLGSLPVLAMWTSRNSWRSTRIFTISNKFTIPNPTGKYFFPE
jgi:hypothetical protein